MPPGDHHEVVQRQQAEESRPCAWYSASLTGSITVRIRSKGGRWVGSCDQHSTIRSCRSSGHSGGTASKSGRWPLMTMMATFAKWSPSYGTSRQITSKRIMLYEYTSTFSSYSSSPVRTSGADQCCVPTFCVMTSPAILSASLDCPKSVTFTSGSVSEDSTGSARSKFSDFKSRWIIWGLEPCRQRIARATSQSILTCCHHSSSISRRL
mmetsp:Transcript_32060/g.88324  ORF Transcript_32060/g.88324 Transcript_32060/m.88324 type:complete len:209 (+) Transcript_32060:206-832(+)